MRQKEGDHWLQHVHNPFYAYKIVIDHVDHRCVVTVYDETVVLKLFPNHTYDSEDRVCLLRLNVIRLPTRRELPHKVPHTIRATEPEFTTVGGDMCGLPIVKEQFLHDFLPVKI